MIETGIHTHDSLAAHATTETGCNTDPESFSVGHCAAGARSSPQITTGDTPAWIFAPP